MEKLNNYPALPTNYLWQQPTMLILDGVSVPDILPTIYQQAAANQKECLYVTTQWQELQDISPCLISLNNEQEPLLSDYLNSLQNETGYLIVSNAPWQQITAHLRWLLQVNANGQTLMLRLADPAVMSALLRPENQTNHTTLMGPIQRIIMPDPLTQEWNIVQNPNQITHYQAPQEPYKLSDEDLEQLGEVNFRQTIKDLDQHLAQKYPRYLNNLTQTERYQKCTQLANEAYNQGYYTQHEITLYANLYGYLGDNVMQNEQITNILSQNEPTINKIIQAEKLARHLATNDKEAV